jgi:hypothetical protein
MLESSVPHWSGRHMPTVECLHCQAELDAPAEYKGRLVKCSLCGKSFVLRFTDHDATVIVKVRSRQSEPAPELKSTVSFRLPDSPDSTSAAESTARSSREAEKKQATPREMMDGR